MPRALKLSGLAVLFAVGVLVAWSLGASGQTADTTTVDTTAASETTTAVDTTVASEITTTVAETVTVSEPTTIADTVTEVSTTPTRTTTVRVTRLIPVAVTGSSATDEDNTADWTWVLLAILAIGLIVLIVLLVRRGRGSVPVDERRRHLDAAVASWSSQGWALESETADSAVLRRTGEAMLLSVDTVGHVSTRPLPAT